MAEQSGTPGGSRPQSQVSTASGSVDLAEFGVRVDSPHLPEGRQSRVSHHGSPSPTGGMSEQLRFQLEMRKLEMEAEARRLEAEREARRLEAEEKISPIMGWKVKLIEQSGSLWGIPISVGCPRGESCTLCGNTAIKCSKKGIV